MANGLITRLLIKQGCDCEGFGGFIPEKGEAVICTHCGEPWILNLPVLEATLDVFAARIRILEEDGQK